MHATIEELLEAMFSVGYATRLYTRNRIGAEKVKRHLELPSWISCETLTGQ
jgi:hypothetical protein